MTSLFLALVAGVLTTLNPCVLPMLPLVLTGALAQGRWGPVVLVLGLILSFTTIGVGLTVIGFGAGLGGELIRYGAATLLLATGLLLTNATAQAAFARLMSPVSNSANNQLNKIRVEGNPGQFLLGVLLGAIWSPCVGPTLGAAMALAAQGQDILDVTITMIVFSFGMSLVFLLIAYGSRFTFNSRGTLIAIAAKARPIFGWLLILTGALILSGFDKILEAELLKLMPEWLISLTTRF